MMIGIVILTGISILIFLGMAHRVLDRLYLSDRGGLLFIAALIAGSFIDIPVWRNPSVTINVGGAILPVVLAVYVLSKAGSGKEWVRSITGIIITTGILYAINRFYHFDTRQGIIEPQYLWAILAGVAAYLAGRSRRLSFIIATLGIVAMDIVYAFETGRRGINAITRIGGAGIFDTVIIAGILAVLLAEIIGESREALQGGPGSDRPREFNEALDHPPVEPPVKNKKEGPQ
ncbi:MAG: DUF1614 domain-containing protein [Firmicutes bacterium]|nr:DUF1614 domain-containing protein [Bacillota bacterium]